MLCKETGSSAHQFESTSISFKIRHSNPGGDKIGPLARIQGNPTHTIWITLRQDRNFDYSAVGNIRSKQNSH